MIITFEQCAVFAGLAPNEMIFGVTPSHSLLLSYLLNRKRGPEAVRKMIVADLRASLDIGAPKMAADLLVVLRWFLSDHPEARIGLQKAGEHPAGRAIAPRASCEADTMISIEQCREFSGLGSHEMVLGAAPTASHRSLLSSYLLNLRRGPVAVREMIVADIRASLNLGALNRAADLLTVLRLFLSDHPEARSPRDRDAHAYTRLFLVEETECKGARRATRNGRAPPCKTSYP